MKDNNGNLNDYYNASMSDEEGAATENIIQKIDDLLVKEV